MQAQGVGNAPMKYTGTIDVLRKTVRNEGFRGLYKASHQEMQTDVPTFKPKCVQNLVMSDRQLDGISFILQGAFPNLFKLAPAAGLSWFTFEQIKRFLGVDARS